MVADARQRIDKWLFFSRAVKSRSLAAKLVVAGRVRINRDKAAQASDLVRAGFPCRAPSRRRCAAR
ncbi:S4 domain-containing protein, partial [Mesorhizobium sp. M5C.F.Ca.IN.020.32.2.1]|uniref:S4 domain-containing protein n=1 Tax=Mesorhizobium sp. M5C.F.Ca.IN.020.32.2.1 TaxID=2496771 RepID=UPI000FD2D484